MVRRRRCKRREQEGKGSGESSLGSRCRVQSRAHLSYEIRVFIFPIRRRCSSLASHCLCAHRRPDKKARLIRTGAWSAPLLFSTHKTNQALILAICPSSASWTFSILCQCMQSPRRAEKAEEDKKTMLPCCFMRMFCVVPHTHSHRRGWTHIAVSLKLLIAH